MKTQGTIDEATPTPEPAAPVPHGAKIRPSSLPALEQCPAFHADHEERDYTAAGTARHAAFRALLANASQGEIDEALAGVGTEEEREALAWAVDYVRINAATDVYPLELETRREFVGPDFETYGGTLDVRCGPDIFDLKWRWGRYLPQQAAYGLTIMPPLPRARIHLLFGAEQKAKTYDLDRAAAEAIVHPIIEAATAPDPKPTPCDYCGWCAKRLTCPAIVEGVRAAWAGLGDWGLRSWHTADMEDPREAAKALRIARALEAWAKSVASHCWDLVFRRGVTLPGFVQKSRAGANEVTDVRQAFQLSGMPEDAFWKAVDVRLNATKGKNAKPGLIELYASQNDLSREGAKRELLGKLAGALKRRPPSQYLEDQGDDPDAVV